MDTLRTKAARILESLVQTYGRPEWQPSLDPLSELIFTILSQHTSDVNRDRAFASLKNSFNTWDEVRGAPAERVAEAIRSAGLGTIKAPRIKEALEYVAANDRSQGALGPRSLGFLAEMPLTEAKAWLRSVPGVGPKTAACVLMFGLNRPALPVDTHVFRVSRRLGLIDQRTSADSAHQVLESLVPAKDVYAFHIDLIKHGRKVCIAQNPRCPICTLKTECDYYREYFIPLP